MERQVSLVKAYHAGNLEDIESVILGGYGIPYSASQGNWLGDGIYFWEDDPLRAEHWQIQRNKGAILECEIDTRYLFNLLKKEDLTDVFYTEAKDLLKSLQGVNRKASQNFEFDRKLFNEIRDKFMGQGISGIRMAFHLGESITPNGNVFENQHIQICLWDLTVIENPRKYTGGILD
jgi:hypothetical protein